MDSHTYGSMVEHGGYATGGIITPAPTAMDTSYTVMVCGVGDIKLVEQLGLLFDQGQIQLPGARDPDDGAAGVPAKV